MKSSVVAMVSWYRLIQIYREVQFAYLNKSCGDEWPIYPIWPQLYQVICMYMCTTRLAVCFAQVISWMLDPRIGSSDKLNAWRKDLQTNTNFTLNSTSWMLCSRIRCITSQGLAQCLAQQMAQNPAGSTLAHSSFVNQLATSMPSCTIVVKCYTLI